MTEEGKLQSKIIKYAESKGAFVIKHMKCNVNGFPDLQLFFPMSGRVIFMECKTPTGTLSKIQKKTIDDLGYCKQLVYVLSSFECAKEIIDMYCDENELVAKLPKPNS